MTVSTSNAVSGPFAANGVTTSFPFTFKAMNADEVRVTIVVAGVETEQSSTLYSVELTTGGGTATFGTAPSSGDVYIYSDPAYTQDVALASGQAFSPRVINDALDRAAVRDQDLLRKVNSLLDVFDAGVVGDMRSDLASTATGKGGSLVKVKQVGTDAQARDLQDVYEDNVSLFDFMTSAQKTDYRNQTLGLDLTSAFQAAAAAVTGVGRNLVVNMPPGILNLTSTITTTGPVKFRGYGDVGQGMTGDNTVNNGTAIKLNHTGVGFDVSGFGFECSDCAVYRPQTAPGVGWTPYASDYDFRLAAIDAKVDVLAWGSAKGVKITGGGRIDLRIRGQYFTNAIEVTSATDSVDIWAHLWPYWSGNANVEAYMKANLKSLVLKRCDGGMISRFFSVWHNKAISFEDNAGEITTNFSASNVYCDEGGAGIYVDAAASGVTAQFGNVVHQGHSSVDACAVELAGTGAQISIGNLTSTYATKNTLRNADGTNNRLRVNNLYMTQWNGGNSGYTGSFLQGTGNSTSVGFDASIGTAAAGSTAAFGGTTDHQGQRVRGAIAGTTGGAGLISFAHGLGYTPRSADVTLTGSNNYVCNVISTDATNINCVVYSGASTLNSTAVTGHVNVYY